MSNMSYCRFENTDNDLGACETALEELFAAEDDSQLSATEFEAAVSLVARCQGIVEKFREKARSEDKLDDGSDEPLSEKQIREILEWANEQT